MNTVSKTLPLVLLLAAAGVARAQNAPDRPLRQGVAVQAPPRVQQASPAPAPAAPLPSRGGFGVSGGVRPFGLSGYGYGRGVGFGFGLPLYFGNGYSNVDGFGYSGFSPMQPMAPAPALPTTVYGDGAPCALASGQRGTWLHGQCAAPLPEATTPARPNPPAEAAPVVPDALGTAFGAAGADAAGRTPGAVWPL